MLGLELKEISAQLVIAPNTRTGKYQSVPDSEAQEVILAWFLRLWFLQRLNPNILLEVWSTYQLEDCPYTFFQLVRILFERGLHEPSHRQRSLAKSIVRSIKYVGPPLESTDWWEQSLSQDSRNFYLDDRSLSKLIDLSKVIEIRSIQLLFPQVTLQQFRPDQPLVTSDINAIRTKRYVLASREKLPYTDQNFLTTYDPSLLIHKRLLPPEDYYREYKATFRFDTMSKQKNLHQQFSCLKAICGFLNASGGILVIGVDDNLQVIGLEGDLSLLKSNKPYDAFLQIFHEAIKQFISPIPLGLINAEFLPYGSSFIFLVEISPHHSSVPFLLFRKDQSPAHFVRDGNRTLQISG